MVMARLLKQRLNDYVNQVNRADTEYRDAATAYNATVEDALSGTPYLTKDSSGKQVIVGGKNKDGSLAILSRTTNSYLPPLNNDAYVDPMAGLTPMGQVRYLRTGTGDVVQYHVVKDANEQYSWEPGQTLKSIPTVPEVASIKEPNLTQSNMKELQNPSSDQAGLALQQAYGMEGKSQLAGDVANSRVSAFADPEDPNNLAERGILARTLAGQLG